MLKLSWPNQQSDGNRRDSFLPFQINRQEPCPKSGVLHLKRPMSLCKRCSGFMSMLHSRGKSGHGFGLHIQRRWGSS